MKLNPKIAEKLQEYNIPVEQGSIVLLCIYHGFRIGQSLSEIAQQVNLTKIVERDYEGGGETWNIALYESEINTEDTRWEWVEDFRKMFGEIRKDAIGNKRDCIKKMKKYFADNPDVRKDEVLKATAMYVFPFKQNTQDPKFLQQADYFISKIIKGAGTSEATSRLSMYIELIRVGETPQENAIGERNMRGVIR